MTATLMSYVWTILIAVAGGILGNVLRIPTGSMVGATLAVAVANVYGHVQIPRFSPQINFAIQVGVGILLGSRITAATIDSLKEVWRPALICTTIALVAGIFSALMISRWLGIEALTALLSTAPGGISPMSLMAVDMGVEGGTVLIMHLFRLMSVIVIFPWLVKLLARPHLG